MLKPHLFATYGLAAVLILALITPALAQTPGGKKGKAPEVKTDAQPSGATGTDENIKNPSEQNNPDSAIKAPPDKGGEKTRAGVCHFHVDNRTPWKIQIFVDGDYVGLVAPWGDSTGTYDGGGHMVYGRARFTKGPDITWGPSRISCLGSYRWRLTDSRNGYN
jgi:hypothetical protein